MPERNPWQDRAICAAVVFLICAGRVQAVAWEADFGRWDWADGWSYGEPTASDDAYVNNGGRCVVVESGAECQRLLVSNNSDVELTTGDLTTGLDVRVYRGGTFTQDGGVHTVGHRLEIGTIFDGNATYALNAGILTVDDAILVQAQGEGNTGRLTVESGATFSSPEVYVGPRGQLDLNGDTIYDGYLNVYGGAVDTGDNYLVIQSPTPGQARCRIDSGGSLTTSNLDLGWYDNQSGSMTLNWGTLTVGLMSLGSRSLASGTFEMNGNAIQPTEVNVTDLHVGLRGQGVFTQNDGTIRADGQVSIGTEPGATGAYHMNDGQLITPLLAIKRGDFYYTGRHVIAETLTVGGESTPATIHVVGGGFAPGSYVINLHANGSIDATDKWLGLSHGTGSVCNIDGGSITAYELHVSHRSRSDMTVNHTAGTVRAVYMNVGEEPGATGQYDLFGGTLDADLIRLGRYGGSGKLSLYEGTLISDGILVGGPNGHLNVWSSRVFDGTTVHIEGGRMMCGAGTTVTLNCTATHQTNRITDGSLTAETLLIGKAGPGRFELIGGVCSANTMLNVGSGAGGDGWLDIRGGRFTTGSARLGVSGGAGELLIRGGEVSVTNEFWAATTASSIADIVLTSGELNATELVLARNGQVAMNHVGGVCDVSGDLIIAQQVSGRSHYTLSGGTLNAGSLQLGPFDGAGVFEVVGDDSIIAVGAYEQGWASRLISRLDGEGISLIDVTGSAMLGGVWEVVLDGAPAAARYDVLSAGSLSVSFDDVLLPGAGWSWGVESGDTLYVEYVPEPATMSLLALGGLALIRRRRAA